MADVPKVAEDVARQSWDKAQRVGMQIAAQPLVLRAAAYAIAEESLRESAKEKSIKAPSSTASLKCKWKPYGA